MRVRNGFPGAFGVTRAALRKRVAQAKGKGGRTLTVGRVYQELTRALIERPARLAIM